MQTNSNVEKHRRTKSRRSWDEEAQHVRRLRKQAKQARRRQRREVQDHQAELTDPRRSKLRHVDYR